MCGSFSGLTLPGLIKNKGNIFKGAKDALAPDAPRPPRRLKLPTPPEPDIAARQQHAKEIAIGAYGATDTSLTGGKGLGKTAPKNLWTMIGGSG